MSNSNGNGWNESTEGDLDPDLTEEAGYLWYPRERSWLRPTLRVLGALLLIAFLGGAIISVVGR
ncbi:MAG: hypothetical protein DWI58_11035 [Chloroflexi bacterium]|nr:MAG: hypothetical protein DWI58_11035 [Chloroflexota bacterium]